MTKKATTTDRYEYLANSRYSDLQFSCLSHFADLGKSVAVSARKLLEDKYREGTVKSLIYRKCLVYDPKLSGVRITDFGLSEHRRHGSADIHIKSTKTHFGEFMQSVNRAFSGTFRQKPERGRHRRVRPIAA